MLAELGTPDLDSHASSRSHERDGEAPRTVFYRYLLYSRLSETVNVAFTEIEPGKVSISFQGKYLGAPEASE